MQPGPWHGDERVYEVLFDGGKTHQISDFYLEPEHPLETLARCGAACVREGAP